MSSRLKIVLGADFRYVDQVITTLKSICCHDNYVDFYLLNQDFPPEWFDIIGRKLAPFHSTITNLFVDDQTISQFKTLSHINSPATYFRYFIPKLLNDEKVLYLDCDLVVNGSLTRLFNIDLGDHFVAAVSDPIAQEVFGCTMEFNAGVMLINNRLWKAENICEKALEVTAQYGQTGGDQDVLNLLFRHRWLKLERGVNYQMGIDLMRSKHPHLQHDNDDFNQHLPLITHYSSEAKPWKNGFHTRLRELYWSYYELDWADIVAKHQPPLNNIVLSKPTEQKSVTIVGVTGHSGYTQGTMYAIWRSYLELQPKITNLKCLLISPDKPTELPEFIQHIPTKPFSYLEYNLFMLYCLDQFIDTDFALIVQEDGWVIDGENWQDHFLDYDYIGAIIPSMFNKNDPNQWVGTDYWIDLKGIAPEGWCVPQNGGFCLRSKAMLEAPRKLNLPYNLSHLMETDPIHLPFEMKFNSKQHIEDIYLSVVHRKTLEQCGLTFAPTEVAMQFSLESEFIFNFLHSYNPEKLVSYLSILGRHFMGSVKITGLNSVSTTFKLNSEEELSSSPLAYYLFKKGYEIAIPKKNIQTNCKGDTDPDGITIYRKTFE